jgi:thioredoxin reductase (NADPH)
MAVDTEKQRIIIAGSGPAGLTAAIYAARAGLEPLVVEGLSAGGQLTTTTEVENFPGFPDGITGPDLMANMRRQAERFGALFVAGDIEAVSLDGRPFRIKAGGRDYLAATLVIATGATARYPDIQSFHDLRGRGVSACATCDGFFFRGKKVFVIGGGDTALEEAMFLTRFASEVTIVHRRSELRASQIMQRHARENPKVKFLLNHVPVDALGIAENRVTGLRVRHVESGTEQDLPADGIFSAIGHEPSTALFREYLEVTATGYIIVRPGRTATSLPGVFAAGDVSDDFYRQATVAAGSGCMAALEAEKFLLNCGEDDCA